MNPFEAVQEQFQPLTHATYPSRDTAKNVQSETKKRPSAGLDLMNLVQRVFLTQEPCRVAAFSGVEPNSKSALISLQAARVLAGSIKQDVLLLDADLERIGILDTYSNLKDRGLTTALDCTESVRLHANRIQEPNLYLMLPGPSAGRRPLLTGAMRNFLGRALKEFSFVLIHAPSLVSSSDCITLGQAADGMLLVLEASKTRKAVATRTVQQLESAGTTILGAVLSDTVQPVPDFLYDRL